MNLRPYQTAVIARAADAVYLGARAPLIVAPTGAGKTVIGAEIARRQVSYGGRVLWLAHRRELIDQAATRLRAEGLEVGGDAAPVQVASVQTLLARGAQPPADLVVFDEAHHYAADEWGTLAGAYAGALRVGLTATPERADGRALGDLFDQLLVAATVKELTALGALVPCDVIAPERPLRSGEIAARPVDAYLEHAPGTRAIVFSPHVPAALAHRAEFNEAGVRAEVITGEMAPAFRDHVLALFRNGDVQVIVNVYVLTEGFDDPPTETCILARGCGSTGTYLQMVGRVLRPSPGKERAHLIDLRGVVHLHGMPDEDRRYSLEGRGIRRDVDEEPLEDVRFCAVCGAILEGGDGCPECGTVHDELTPPRVVSARMRKFAFLQRDTDEQKASRLARWIADARRAGHNQNRAMYRYKGAYGDWPSREVRAAAFALARPAKGAA